MKGKIACGVIALALATVAVTAWATSRGVRVFVDGKALDTGATVTTDGTTYVPLRAVAEGLGCDVVYENGRVDIRRPVPESGRFYVSESGEELDRDVEIVGVSGNPFGEANGKAGDYSQRLLTVRNHSATSKRAVVLWAETYDPMGRLSGKTVGVAWNVGARADGAMTAMSWSSNVEATGPDGRPYPLTSYRHIRRVVALDETAR